MALLFFADGPLIIDCVRLFKIFSSLLAEIFDPLLLKVPYTSFAVNLSTRFGLEYDFLRWSSFSNSHSCRWNPMFGKMTGRRLLAY